MAESLLVLISSLTLDSERFSSTPIRYISSGVFLAIRPFPPANAMPCNSGLTALFKTAVKTVVTPDECQSYPRTQPNDWNQKGSESLLRNSFVPYSSINAVTMELARASMRRKSQRGALPPWRGRKVSPVLLITVSKSIHARWLR